MRTSLPIAALLAGMLLPAARADFFDGMAAYRRGDYDVALSEWRPLAEAGDAEAQYRVGTIYEDPDAGYRDDRAAARWFGLAAERGHPKAQGRLGRMYESGRGVEQDQAEAVRWFRRAALQGVAAAQYDLARMFETGSGVIEDAAKALGWYRDAAEKGHVGAQLNLAMMFEQGRGISVDQGKAAKWYRRAAKQGEPSAQIALGLMYDQGRGVEQNRSKAAVWYRRAAEHGLSSARRNLASMYAQGEGVPLDLDEALRWLRPAQDEPPEEAARLRDSLAESITVGRIEELRGRDEAWRPGPTVSGEPLPPPREERAPSEPLPEPDQAATAELQAPGSGRDAPAAAIDATTLPATPPDEAEVPSSGPESPIAGPTGLELGDSGVSPAATGNPEEFYRRARGYSLGDGVPVDHAEAEQWYLRAAERGHGMACYRLGFVHLRGQNASRRKDLVQAYFWFSLAARQQLGDADHWRDSVAGTLSDKERLEAERLLESWALEQESGAAVR